MRLKRGILIVFLAALILSIGFVFISADDEMTVEAKFVGYGTQFIGIEVPDYISLGEVNKDDPFSDEKNIRINNTGTINVKVTPELASGSPAVFDYTYFRKQKTSTTDPSLNVSHKIGEYNIDINADNYETFYMRLDLTDFTGTLSSNNINLSATIKFTAMASS